jgi:hypothetical protein
MVRAYQTLHDEKDLRRAVMPTPPRQPLRIETAQDDRFVVLGCETCSVTVRLRTTDTVFAALVRGFFERHARCAHSLDLPA